MNYKFSIQGISCASCIQKISTLLTNELDASNINFSANNTIIEFGSITETDIKQLNTLLAKIGNYTVSMASNNNHLFSTSNEDKPSYKPIYLIFVYLILVNITIIIKSSQFIDFMPNFMASFFIVFSFFKLLDLEGFSQGYSSYDIIDKKAAVAIE
jgi:cation transport ATPase